MKRALWIHTLTPLHCGTGQVSASVIDLPVAREKATNFPVIPATSLKGVLRDATSKEQQEALFGTQNGVGALQFGDGRLVCFPVRAWKGVFAYVTCPLALMRLARDFAALGVPAPFAEGDIPAVGNDAAKVAGGALMEGTKVYLEDLDLPATQDAKTKALAEKIASAVGLEPAGFVARFALVSDDLFDFLTETATEVTARVALEQETKTVRPGGLWYEEAVPAEAIFVAPVIGKGDAALPKLPATIQIGGNETVGRGVCRIQVVAP